jgi:glycosyltransferase involved in cell wall biosynthesis
MSDKKFVIGIVVPSLISNGGVQSIVEILIKQIEQSEDYEFLLVSLATSAKDEYSTRIFSPLSFLSGVRLQQAEWRGRKLTHVGCLFAEFEFMRYRPRKKLSFLLANCDLIQVVGGFPAWGACTIGLSKPVSVWAATRCILERRRSLSLSSGIKAYYFCAIAALVNRLDDRVIKYSNALMVMNSLMHEYTAKIKVNSPGILVNAPPGVDTSFFLPNLNRAQQLFQCNNFYILSVGRFNDPRKNIELLLESYVLLRGRLKVMPKLLLAGAGAPARDFWKKVNGYGLQDQVSFLENPSQDQLKELYQNAACFALSSDEEGFGMVLLEAMACGIPVISTRSGGPQDIIDDGENGYLVDVGDASVFSEKLALLSSDKPLNTLMGVRAREKVEKKFSQTVMAQSFFKTWKFLLNSKNGS